MVRALLCLTVVAAVAAPGDASAQGIFEKMEAGPYFAGAIYRYRVARSGGPLADRESISLPLALDVLEIRDATGAPVPGLSAVELPDCAAGNPDQTPPYECDPVVVGNLTYVLSVTGGTIQEINITSAALLSDWPEHRVVVRMRAQDDDECSGIPTCGWLNGITVVDFAQDDSFNVACLDDNNGLVGLGVSSANPIVTFRGDGAHAIVPLADPSDAVLNQVSFRCASPGGGLTACNDGAFVAFALHVPSTFPAGATVTPANPFAPPPGNQEGSVELRVAESPGAVTTVIVRVEEQAADTVALSASPGSVRPGQSSTVTVERVENASGGNEPLVAGSWEIDVVPSPIDPLDPLVITQLDDRSARLDVPPTFPFAGVDEYTVTVRAHHLNPDATETAGSIEVTILPGGGPTSTCRLAVEPSHVGPGGQTRLRLESSTDDVNFAPVDLALDWQVVEGSGTVVAGAGAEAVFRAPEEPTRATVRARAAACPAGVSTVIEVTELFDLDLVASRTTVTPGQVVRLEGTLHKLTEAALEGVRFVLVVDPALKPLRRAPAGARPLAGIDGADANAVVPAADRRQLAFAIDLPTGAEGFPVTLPVLARAAFAGTEARATLRVYYAEGQTPALPGVVASPVAEASVRIRLLEDPEFSDATLIGKVFHDRNGDGVQQEGESGLAGAMVALATGIYALTDESGKYHIARLAPGRHAVKVNVATLPMGAALTTDEVRVLTLTPGVFSKVSFGVRLPDLGARQPLALAATSGLTFLDGAATYRAQLTGVVGPRLIARHLENQIVVEVNDGSAVLDLPLGDDAVWTLLERDVDGRVYVSSFAVFAYPRDSGGTLVVPWGPRPVAHMVLPPPTRRVSTAELVLVGEAPAAGRVEISRAGEEAGCTLEVEAGGSLRCNLDSDSALEELVLRIDPAPDENGVDGPRQAIQVPVFVEPTSHFLVGHLGVELGVDFAGDELLWPDGGGAFLYKGQLEDGWEVTAGADARVREVLLSAQGNQLRNVGAQLLKHDPTRVFRDLDPEEFYPSYGDGSHTVDERESGGRFFLRVQKDSSYLKWGGINTAIDDAEYGRFVRSLYGFGGVVELGDEELALSARGFAAQPDTVPARDELTVTGGTLYFLGHRGVVEGSLRVTLEVLDEISGLPVRATPLTEGIDYEADHAGGRVVLDAALPYRMFGTRLTSDGAGGHRGRLIVEYEYLGNAASDWSLGGRVVGTWGPVSLGATGVTELVGLVDDDTEVRSRYWLAGGTLRLDLGDPLRVRVEAAHSDGGSVDAGRSSDGGLSFSSRVNSAGQSGNAVSAEIATGFAGAHAGLYGRFVEPGFSDTRTAPGRRLVQGGLRLDTEFVSGTKVWGNYDHRETRLRDTGLRSDPASVATGLVVRDLGLLGVSQRLGPIDMSVEGRYEAQRDDRHRALAAAEISYRLSSGVTLSLRRRQLLDADSTTRDASTAGETSAGVLLESAGGSRFAAEAGASDDAELFGRAQATVPVTDDTELYAGYQVTSHLGVGLDPVAGEEGSRVVAGGRRNADDGTVLYSEQSLGVDGSDRMLTRTVGAKVPVSQRTHLSVSYERGSLDPDDTLSSVARVRDAVSVGTGFVGERINARLSADGRLDRQGRGRGAELAAHGRVDVRATDDLTLALAGRGGSGYAGDEGANLETTRQAWEGAVGFALRPVHDDTLNVFGRYALVYERDRLEGDGPWLRSTSHVLAAALVYDVWGPFAISPKVAYRNTRVTGVGIDGTDQALLAALRGDVHLTGSWDATLEGRACAAPGAHTDARFGALAEVSLLVLEWLRLGGGYNFSSISASGVQCEEPGARGLFLRAEAIY